MSIKIKPFSISPQKTGHRFQLLHKTEPSLPNISRVERSAVCGTETLFALHSSGSKLSSSYFMQASAFIKCNLQFGIQRVKSLHNVVIKHPIITDNHSPNLQDSVGEMGEKSFDKHRDHRHIQK